MDIHIDTHTHTYTHNGQLLSHKENEIVPFAAPWMVLEGIMLSEKGQKRQLIYDITYIWNLKCTTNKGT